MRRAIDRKTDQNPVIRGTNSIKMPPDGWNAQIIVTSLMFVRYNYKDLGRL
jgi:hypothetical protein